jgi:hypothetical protein
VKRIREGAIYVPKFQRWWLTDSISGFLENSVRITYAEYARKRADSSVADFVESRLRQFQNPKMGTILDLTGGFKWGAWRVGQQHCGKSAQNRAW